MALYQIFSGPMQTTGALATLSTGTTIKTLMQVVPSATLNGQIAEWGISFDGTTANTPIKVELIETNVAATVTAYVQNDLTQFDSLALTGGNQTTNLIQCGTALSGYNASAEGSITTVRNFDVQLIAPTNQYVKQFPLGYMPTMKTGAFTRIRVTAGAAVNAYAYITLQL